MYALLAKGNMASTCGLASRMMCRHSLSDKKPCHRKARGCHDRTSTLPSRARFLGLSQRLRAN